MIKMAFITFAMAFSSLFATISTEEYCHWIGTINPVRQNIKTLNQKGSAYCFNTELTNAFLEECAQKHVLEIGCAYGIKSMQIVQKGAYLVANDLSSSHIELMQKAFNHFAEHYPCFNNVNYIRGNLLEMELTQQFEAILIESVLHFLSPNEIRAALAKMNELLIDEGKVYITVSSPFLKHFAQVYEERKNAGDPWPGFFADPESIHPDNARLHKPYHTFDFETLQRELNLAGFEVVSAKYIDKPHQEQDLAYDGREGLIVIARKTRSNG